MEDGAQQLRRAQLREIIEFVLEASEFAPPGVWPTTNTRRSPTQTRSGSPN
jgi:hypothetical protein